MRVYQEHKSTCLDTQCFVVQRHADAAFAHRAGFCKTESGFAALKGVMAFVSRTKTAVFVAGYPKL